jgi:hypothetical protein
MSTPAWFSRNLDRLLTDRDRRVAFTLVLLVLIAAALLLAVNTPGTPSVSETPATRRHAPAAHQAQRDPDLQAARAVARRFLRGYLAAVYGHEPASAVSDAAPRIAAALAAHRRVPLALSRRHPRIVAVNAAPTGEAANVVVTATVSDDEVLTYPIRLFVTRSRGGQLVVAKVGEG